MGWQDNFTSALNYPKKVVDTAAAYYSGLPEALNPNVEVPAAGELAAGAVFPEVDPGSWQEAVKTGLETTTDVATNPLTYALAAGGGTLLGGLGKAAPRVSSVPPGWVEVAKGVWRPPF